MFTNLNIRTEAEALIGLGFLCAELVNIMEDENDRRLCKGLADGQGQGLDAQLASGKSARGMIIIDRKDMYLTPVDKLTHYRRFELPKARQLKRVVEFSHSIDSLRHPLIQLSDLVIYTTRKFLEYDNGYRPNWSAEAKNIFASCYDRVQTRMWRTNLIDVDGEEEQKAHALLKLCQSTHNGQ